MTSKALVPVSFQLPTGSLETYLQRVQQIPMLSEAEERAYAMAYHQTEDLHAAEQLVLAHLRYVARIAKQYKGYGLALADLVQEGTVGLMKAVKRYDPNAGARLATFALHWIKSEIHEFVIRNWRVVKIATTKAQRKLFFNLRRYKQDAGWLTKDEVSMIADDLGVPTREVLEMEKRLYQPDMAYDTPSVEGDDVQYLAPVAQLAGPETLEPSEFVFEQSMGGYARERMYEGLAKLDDRSRRILEARWLGDKKTPFRTLAVELDLSIERVRQLEAKAIAALRESVVSD